MSQQIQVSENYSRMTEKAKGKRALRQNPFTTYRDPETGRWVVVKSIA